MLVRIRLFAVCRDRAGSDEIEVTLPDEGADVRALQAAVAEAFAPLAPLMPVVRVAVNQEFAAPEDPIRAGDELALIPPVSGGDGLLIAIRNDPVTTEEVESAVRHPGAGAVVSFVGTVRDHTKGHDVTRLDYEAYVEMAEKYLRRVGEEVMEKWPGTRAAILHRIGELVPGEASVAIAVSSPHRPDAFEGCRHAIERLKEDVPIWKREHRTDGTIWVGVGS